MMYEEFIEKTGLKIDYSSYCVGVEVVYRNLPEIVYGGKNNTDFCKWVVQNGGMELINALYPLCENFETSKNVVKILEDKINAKSKTIAEQCIEIQKLENKLKVYKQLISKESLLKKLGELDCEQLLDMVDLSKLR